MAPSRASDTIKIMVSTDNHVGYMERDPVRGDDSWRSFDEVMRLAYECDVDMVLLAGDLFHENNPSRKSMYQVMRSLRTYTYGDKPCEIQMLSDGSEHFAGAFNDVNYHDPNINISIPVFSIHGNHDDPSGEGHLAALDILQASGLLNYYGRTPESDNIQVKPVLLQKGQTKLALYGLSNVRDERLFRTFRDGNVRFFRSATQHEDWFNLMSVHQNHHAHTETGHLPEKFLPSFMDLIIWGHEHKCEIDPIINPEKGFKVMQPGSSIATSLCEGEAEPKHVAILSVTGKEFTVEPIRLKTVRPFIMKDIALRDYPEMCDVAHKSENRTRITQFLTSIIDDLIQEANDTWLESHQTHGDDADEDDQPPLPLVRLRVETTPPEGGRFEIENPQRFSNRFNMRVANNSDVIQCHRKRTAVRTSKNQANMPEESVLAQLSIDNIKVDKLVKEFLTAQSLTILPQNSFSDAVSQFVDKDDKYAMGEFLRESLQSQVDSLLHVEDDDEDEAENEQRMANLIETHRLRLEEAHAKGERRRLGRKGNRKPKPAGWDSDEDGHWEDSVMSIAYDDDAAGQDGQDNDDDAVSTTSRARPAARGRGGRGGRGGKPASSGAATSTKAAAPTKGRKSKQPFEDDEAEDDDVIMIDDDDDVHSDDALFVRPTRKAAPAKPTPQAKPSARSTRTPAASKPSATATTARQTQLSFASQSAGRNGTTRSSARAAAPKGRLAEPSDDEISDDDAFEPPPPAQQSSRTRRR